MAGNKISTKSKGKEDKSKVGKGNIQTSEETDDLDYTLLRKPILTSVTGFAQARKIFDFATEELKSLLSTECDLIYECKVCRNLFRSLANFISHKRMYCKDKFNSSTHSHFVNPTRMYNEINKIKQLEDEYQESLKVTSNQESVEIDEPDDRIPLTKDLTAIVEKIGVSKGVRENSSDDQELFLQNIPKTSVAVYQNVNFNNETNCDIRTQVDELDNILSRNKAVLQHDGKFVVQNSIETNATNGEHENIIQISDDDENEDINSLKCRICDLQFSTLKTLKFHMKYKHLESRLVFPCPDCLEIFSTSWSVYRHLFKVHRKRAAQIRRLRESIQAKAFRMNNPPAYYEKRKRENNNKPSTPPKITEEERLEQENQAWMDNMEGDGEIPRCGGCGRTFERRAALAAHTHTCQPRCRALARRADTKKIEIQIRKDYNKGPSGISLPANTPDNNVNKVNKEEIKTIPKPSSESSKLEEVTHESATIMRSDPPETSIPPDVKLFTERRTVNNSHNFRPKLPHAQQIEKNNLAALRLRLQPDTDLEKLLCKKCDTKHSQILELYEHMAGHYKWMRYACKLCNFKNYGFGNLLEHVKVVHKLKGDSDFYYSTVKAIDANEAIELAEPVEQILDTNEASPDSRRTSRCSSDSSRLSDESSSSSVRIEGAKKRKMNSGRSIPKKKKEIINDDSMDKRSNSALGEKESIPEIEYVNTKMFEENSSDIDDIEEKMSKKQIVGEKTSMASRRPIRKRTRPKNEDFEYDLSNLLKLEAQGYRDSQIVTTKPSQNKRKSQIEIQNTYEMANRDCCGALLALSKKAIENAAAHMKVLSFTMNNNPKEQRPTNVFVRPMIPKVTKAEKTSPKKDSLESPKEVIIVNKITPESQMSGTSTPVKEAKVDTECNEKHETIIIQSPEPTTNEATVNSNDDKNIEKSSENRKEVPVTTESETAKTNSNIPIVPLKLRRQSVDLIKNPILNKNYSDLSKVGMKTKILVIKPINRNKDGTQTIKAPLKFQTIKLKDPNKGNASKEEKSKDQVVVVQVPKVDCAVTLPSIVLPNTPSNVVDHANKNCGVVEGIVDETKNEKEVDQKEMTE